MKRIALLLLIIVAGSVRAQSLHLDSVVVISDSESAVLDLHGHFGQTVGKVWIDSVLPMVKSWSDSIVRVQTLKQLNCGSVRLEVGDSVSNSRTLTTVDIFGSRITGIDTMHKRYFEATWHYDYHSYFRNHKANGTELKVVIRYFAYAPGDTMDYHFDKLSTTWIPSYSTTNPVLTFPIDSNFVLLPSGHQNVGNAFGSYSIDYTAREICPPPLTAAAIFRGVNLYRPQSHSYHPDTTGVQLQWIPSQYFDTYHLQVSNDSTLSSVLIDTTITPSQFTLPTLQSHMTYYWRVSGNNVEGESRWSPVWRFRTEVDPASLPPPHIDSMKFVSDTFEASGILNIWGSFGQKQGTLWFDTLAVPIVSWSDSLLVVRLPAHGNQMMMRCGGVHVEVDGRSSNYRMITSGAAALQVMNDQFPQHASGYNLHWRVDLHSYFLNHRVDHAPLLITCASGTDGDAKFDFVNRRITLHVVAYGVTPPLPMDSSLTLVTSGTTNKGSYPYLNYDLYQFCQVPQTAVMIYRGPSLYLPPNNSHDPDSTGVQLQWVASQYFDNYHLQVSTDSSFASVLVDTNLTQFVCAMPTLRFHTAYYWRVNGTNVEGTSRWSDVWKFTTDAALGVKPQDEAVAFTCTPNPASNILNITLPAPARVVLYDLRGNTVRSVTASEPMLRIETGDIASGTYIVGVFANGKRQSQVVSIVH